MGQTNRLVYSKSRYICIAALSLVVTISLVFSLTVFAFVFFFSIFFLFLFPLLFPTLLFFCFFVAILLAFQKRRFVICIINFVFNSLFMRVSGQIAIFAVNNK